jgi:hypothetical protein
MATAAGQSLDKFGSSGGSVLWIKKEILATDET